MRIWQRRPLPQTHIRYTQAVCILRPSNASDASQLRTLPGGTQMITEPTASPATTPAAASTPLVDFFSATEARVDRWRQLSAVVRAWEATPSQHSSSDALFAEAVVLFSEVAPLEAFF